MFRRGSGPEIYVTYWIPVFDQRIGYRCAIESMVIGIGLWAACEVGGRERELARGESDEADDEGYLTVFQKT